MADFASLETATAKASAPAQQARRSQSLTLSDEARAACIAAQQRLLAEHEQGRGQGPRQPSQRRSSRSRSTTSGPQVGHHISAGALPLALPADLSGARESDTADAVEAAGAVEPWPRPVPYVVPSSEGFVPLRPSAQAQQRTSAESEAGQGRLDRSSAAAAADVDRPESATSAVRLKRCSKQLRVCVLCCTQPPRLPLPPPKDLPDDELCCVCLERRRAVCLVPCGHMTLCTVCADGGIELCPVCRERIIHRQRVYF